MTSKVRCTYCKNSFRQSYLHIHQKTVAYCLKIQSDLKQLDKHENKNCNENFLKKMYNDVRYYMYSFLTDRDTLELCYTNKYYHSDVISYYKNFLYPTLGEDVLYYVRALDNMIYKTTAIQKYRLRTKDLEDLRDFPYKTVYNHRYNNYCTLYYERYIIIKGIQRHGSLEGLKRYNTKLSLRKMEKENKQKRLTELYNALLNNMGMVV